MGCSSCGKVKDRIKKAVTTAINNVVAMFGKSTERSTYEQRINICRTCGFLKLDDWYCQFGKVDARRISRNESAKCKAGKW